MADHAARAAFEEQKVRRSLITPEGVDLSLKLADGGQRFSAFLLDLLIMLAVLIAGTLLIILAAASLSSTGRWGPKVAGIIWLLGFFLLRNFYFILMEMGPKAATFGKRICGLRVVSAMAAASPPMR